MQWRMHLPLARCEETIECFGALLIFKMQRPWVLLGDSPWPQKESGSIAVFRACSKNVLHLDLASKKEESKLLSSQGRCQKSQAAESEWIGCCSRCKLRFSFQNLKRCENSRWQSRNSRQGYPVATILARSQMPSYLECHLSFLQRCLE